MESTAPWYMILTLVEILTGHEINREHYARPVYADELTCIRHASQLAKAKASAIPICTVRRPGMPCVDPNAEWQAMWEASCDQEAPK